MKDFEKKVQDFKDKWNRIKWEKYGGDADKMYRANKVEFMEDCWELLELCRIEGKNFGGEVK